MNIVLDSTGVPCRAPLEADLSELDLLTTPSVQDGLFSLILPLLHSDPRDFLLKNLATGEHRSRLRSAGSSGGLWLRAVPDSTDTTMTDGEFRRACLGRMGLAQALVRASCKLNSATAGSDHRCAALLRATADHAVVCKSGRGVSRVHAFLRDSLANFCTQAGLEAHTEVTVLAWTTWKLRNETGWRLGVPDQTMFIREASSTGGPVSGAVVAPPGLLPPAPPPCLVSRFPLPASSSGGSSKGPEGRPPSIEAPDFPRSPKGRPP